MAALVKGLDIEDLPAIVRYLKGQITKLGVNIRLVKEFNPSEIEETRPDVVILDVRLTRQNGIQILEEIKAGIAAPVVIVLSTFPYPQYHKWYEQLGADFFLDKATEIHRVAEVIRALGDR